jgi:hypothetical protein
LINNPVAYEDPRMELINIYSKSADIIESNNWPPLTTVTPRYFLEHEIKGPVNISVPKHLFSIKEVDIVLSKIGINLICPQDRNDYPKAIVDLRSVINTRKIRSEKELTIAIQKFNYFNKVRLENML